MSPISKDFCFPLIFLFFLTTFSSFCLLISMPFCHFRFFEFSPFALFLCLCCCLFISSFSSLLFSSTSLYSFCIPVLFVYIVKASNVKLQVWLPVVSSEDCGRIYAEKRISIGDGQLCAGGVEGKDSCIGDSGGALMSTGISPRDGRARYFVAGVVSFGPESCGTKDWPGVYTRVSHYADWILDQLAE
jgi:secreted trypsin-like serine protease